MDASSVLSDDFSDYDVLSDVGHRSTDSSIADLDHIPALVPSEPAVSQAARQNFYTASLSPENIQAYVRKALGTTTTCVERNSASNGHGFQNKTMRIYVDGVFDEFSVGHALQLRQAKLSFPSVYLIVGVFSDELCRLHGSHARVTHVERCELVRHCRWVDQVDPDAPWTLDKDQLMHQRIDYIALDEGTSVDPSCDKIRLNAYDAMKYLGKVIPTRRTIYRCLARLSVPTTPTHLADPSITVDDHAVSPDTPLPPA